MLIAIRRAQRARRVIQVALGPRMFRILGANSGPARLEPVDDVISCSA